MNESEAMLWHLSLFAPNSQMKLFHIVALVCMCQELLSNLKNFLIVQQALQKLGGILGKTLSCREALGKHSLGIFLASDGGMYLAALLPRIHCHSKKDILVPLTCHAQ